MYATGHFFSLDLTLLHLLNVESKGRLAGCNFLAQGFSIPVLWVWGLDFCQVPQCLRCHWSVLKMLWFWTIPWACWSLFPHRASIWNTSLASSSLLLLWSCTSNSQPTLNRKPSFMPPFYWQGRICELVYKELVSLSLSASLTVLVTCLQRCNLLVSTSVIIYCLILSPHITLFALREQRLYFLFIPHRPLKRPSCISCSITVCWRNMLYIPPPCFSWQKDVKLRSGGPTVTVSVLHAWTMVSAMKIPGSAFALLGLWGGRVKKVSEYTWWLNHSLKEPTLLNGVLNLDIDEKEAKWLFLGLWHLPSLCGLNTFSKGYLL